MYYNFRKFYSISLIIILVFLLNLPMWSSTLILPFRVRGEFSKTGFSQTELSKGYMELSLFYGKKYIKMDFLTLSSVNKLIKGKGFPYWNKLTSSKLHSICQSTDVERIVAGDVFFTSKKIHWKALFYNCSTGRINFKTKASSKAKDYLRGFYDFNKRLFRGYPFINAEIKEVKAKKNIVFLLDTSGKNFSELNSMKSFMQEKIHNFDFSHYSLTFISMSPRGTNLYYHLDMADGRLEDFFQKLDKRGYFETGLPLHSALNRIGFDKYAQGEIFLLTSDFPHESSLQNYSLRQVIRLYRNHYRFNVLACKGLNKKGLNFYRKLSRLGGGRVLSLAYSQKVSEISGSTFYLSMEDNNYFTSEKNSLVGKPEVNLKYLISKSIVKPVYFPRKNSGRVSFREVLSYLEEKKGRPFLKIYPLENNLTKYLAKVLIANDKNKNGAGIKQYLMKSDGYAFWVKCNKNCQELDSLQLNKEVHLGLSLQAGSNSYQYFFNNPSKVLLRKSSPLLLTTTIRKLIKYKHYYQRNGFEPKNPVWFIKCKKIDSKNKANRDIRD